MIMTRFCELEEVIGLLFYVPPREERGSRKKSDLFLVAVELMETHGQILLLEL